MRPVYPPCVFAWEQLAKSREWKRCRQFAESLPWRCAKDKRNAERGIVTVRS